MFTAVFKIPVSTILSVEIIPITKDGERLTCYKTLARFQIGDGIWDVSAKKELLKN